MPSHKVYQFWSFYLWRKDGVLWSNYSCSVGIFQSTRRKRVVVTMNNVEPITGTSAYNDTQIIFLLPPILWLTINFTSWKVCWHQRQTLLSWLIVIGNLWLSWLLSLPYAVNIWADLWNETPVIYLYRWFTAICNVKVKKQFDSHSFIW